MFCSNQNFRVENCTDFCLESTDDILAAKTSHCHARVNNETDKYVFVFNYKYTASMPMGLMLYITPGFTPERVL